MDNPAENENGLQHEQRGALADAWVHAIGVTAGAIGAVVLLLHVTMSQAAIPLAPIAIYAAGLVAMLGCSAAYNLCPFSRWREALRRLDHAAIFLMIAGTYTPLIALRLSEAWAIGLGAVIWATAGVGILLKLCRPQRIEAISVVLYLLLGWAGVVGAREFLQSVEHPVLVLLVIGGLVYSAGVVFHLSDDRAYQRALWHGSVLAAAAIHYCAVFSLVSD